MYQFHKQVCFIKQIVAFYEQLAVIVDKSDGCTGQWRSQGGGGGARGPWPAQTFGGEFSN